MSDLTYLDGNVLEPIGAGTKFIAHVCNDRAGWGKGLVVQISRKWPEPEQIYREFCRDNVNRLGMVQDVQVEDDIHVLNLIAQHGYKSASNPVPLDYAALEHCLREADKWIQYTKDPCINVPYMMGCGLAGGYWPTVAALLQENITVPVFVHKFRG